MPAPYTVDHIQELTIIKMVLNRLPFLTDTVPNTLLISDFILEVMSELEPCFRVGEALIGLESSYTKGQRVCIADFVAYYIMVYFVALASNSPDGAGGAQATPGTFLSKAKAGSVEVEYDQFDLNGGGGFGMGTSGEKLMNIFLGAGIRRALGLGCTISVTDGGLELKVGDYTAALAIGQWTFPDYIGTVNPPEQA